MNSAEILKPEPFLKPWVAQMIGQSALWHGHLGWDNSHIDYIEVQNQVHSRRADIAVKTGQKVLPASIKKPIRINFSKHITESGR